MTTADPSREIPRKMIDRYRKLLTLAEDDGAAPNERSVARTHVEKLEARFPGIRDVVNRVERREQARAMRAGEVWVPPRPSREEIESMIPKALRKVGDLLGVRLVDLTESALDWAVNEIEQAAEDYVWMGYTNGDGLDPGGLILLTDLIEQEVDVAVEEADDDETGEALVVVELTMPVDVWRRLCDAKNGPKHLVRHVDKLYMGVVPDNDGEQE